MSLVYCLCGATAKGYPSVGDTMKATGYEPVFLVDGSILWTCPQCWKLIEEAYGLIERVLKGKTLDANLYSIGCAVERRRKKPATKKEP